MKYIIIALFSLLQSGLIFSQTPEFAIKFGGISEDNGYHLTVDNNGDIIAVGRFFGTADFDPGPSTYELTSNGSNDLFVAKYSSTGTFIWAFNIGSTDREAADKVVVDNANNIYITGYFRETVDFDPSGSVSNLVSNGNNGVDPGWSGEIFVAKYNSNGLYQWAFSIGGPTTSDEGQHICIDNNGDVLISGVFAGSNVDFDPDPVYTYYLDAPTEQMFIAKYSSGGALIWAKQMGGPVPNNETIRMIATDNSGNIYATGFYTGSADFDPGPGTANLSASSVHQGFVAKYNSSGNYIWAYDFGGTGFNQGWSIAVDTTNGSIFLTGIVEGSSISFSGGNGTIGFTNSGGTEVFISKYDFNGDILFARKIAGTSDEHAFYISLDVPSNSLYITGMFEGTCDFNPASAQTANLTSAGGADAFVARYSLSGTYAGAFQIGSGFEDWGRSVIASGTSIFVIGSFSGNAVDFNPGAGSLPLSSSGNLDGFIAKYNWSSITPVTLTDFNGQTRNSSVLLTWTTGNESNFKSIEVERSFDGVNFSIISTIPAKGSSILNEYKYEDHDFTTLPKKVFYRLALIDIDGSIIKSKIISFSFAKALTRLHLYPNPLSNSTELSFTASQNGEAVIKIIDMSGKTVFQKESNVQKGLNKFILNFEKHLANGVYTLSVSLANELNTERIIITH